MFSLTVSFAYDLVTLARVTDTPRVEIEGLIRTRYIHKCVVKTEAMRASKYYETV